MSLQPRNTEILDALERESASHLAAMARGSILAGQLPPKSVLDWYGRYVAEALIATESMAQQITKDTSADEAEAIGVQLEMCVVALSELLTQCAKHKLFVLNEQIMQTLRARALHLPTTFDTSYGGLIPKV